MTMIYAIMAMVAFLLLIAHLVLIRSREPWLLLLYICVTLVNVGYFLLSISQTLTWAILANDLVYLGSVCLSLCMLMTILNLCGFRENRRLSIVLVAISMAMFAVVCTAGLLPWYYKEVSLVFVDGAAKLQKVYGVLHPLYMVYLLGYFTAMICAVVISRKKGLLPSRKHAAMLAMVVLGNIAVWMVEKFVPWDFEFLSVSYLFSELILLGLYWIMLDYMPGEKEQSQDESAPLPEHLLTPKEREVLKLLRQGIKRREIAETLCLSENTVKTHIRNLYSKLGINSRDEL